MSIRKAIFNGEKVSASLGERLRDKELTCRMCKAKMHIHRYPNSDDYYFALNPGEKHTRACRFFDAAGRDIPELMESVAEFINRLMRLDKDRTSDHEGTLNAQDHNGDESPTRRRGTKLTGIKSMIKSGYYFADPYDIAFEEQNIRYIDLVIYDKWFNLVWKDALVNIGPRVVDTRWIGSFNLHPSRIIQIEESIYQNKEIWFRSFRKSPVGNYTSVMFCLDIHNCYSGVLKKLFGKGVRRDGSYTAFAPHTIPDGEPLDVLIASDWHPIPIDDCHKECPLRKCEGCLGSYWGKCNSAKQIEVFVPNQDYKDKNA